MDISSSLRDFIKENCNKYYTTSQSFVFDCPLCLGKKKLYIRKKDGRFICFKCKELHNFSGRAEYALSKITGFQINEVKSFIYGIAKNDKSDLDLKFDEEELIIEEAIQIVNWPLDFYPIGHKYSERGADYLKNRGIPIEVANYYGIRFHPISNRVCFPVYSGIYLVGWQGRAIYDEIQPKAQTSLGLEKSKFLMFSELIKNNEHLIICEGPIDAIKCFLIGNSVATMGKNISVHQINLIKELNPKCIYLALDPDAYLETQKLIDAFYGFIKLKIIILPSNKKDIGELSLEETKDVINNAQEINPNKIFLYLK